jgi:hypothetical protein
VTKPERVAHQVRYAGPRRRGPVGDLAVADLDADDVDEHHRLDPSRERRNQSFISSILASVIFEAQ